MKKWLSKSPINFFSDLLMCTIAGGYLVTLLIMLLIGIYATVHLSDTSVWGEVRGLVEATTCGTGGIWLCKCAAQHVIAGTKGETLEPDFPSTDCGTISSTETNDDTSEGAVG